MGSFPLLLCLPLPPPPPHDRSEQGMPLREGRSSSHPSPSPSPRHCHYTTVATAMPVSLPELFRGKSERGAMPMERRGRRRRREGGRGEDQERRVSSQSLPTQPHSITVTAPTAPPVACHQGGDTGHPCVAGVKLPCPLKA